MKYGTTGDIHNDEGRGWKRKTSEKQDNQIILLSKKYSEVSAREISQKIEIKGIIASPTTIQRRFNEFGMIYKAPIAKPLLIQNHRDARLEFAQRSSKTN